MANRASCGAQHDHAPSSPSLRRRAREIHVDNDGDAEPDISYEWRFDSQVRNPNTFLYNTGPITSIDDPDFNLRQFYTVAVEGPLLSNRAASSLGPAASNMAVFGGEMEPRCASAARCAGRRGHIVRARKPARRGMKTSTRRSVAL